MRAFFQGVEDDDPENETTATGAFARVMQMLTPKRGTQRPSRSRAADGRPLVLGLHAGVRRHYLTDRVVERGTVLHLKLVDGAWLAGRYEWSLREGDAPQLVIAFDGGGQHAIPLPPSAVLRWPPVELDE